MMENDSCIFCKILRNEIPAQIIYEDDDLMAFNDINPAAPVHFLIIPRMHIASLMECEETHQAVLGKMLLLAPELAKEQGCIEGFRTIINTGRVGGQEVFHLHIHIIGSKERLPAMMQKS
ncbi:histidine triad (HIT) family protein [Nitrosomonas marina]|uniref:Histidine triad (HIT) family protein n=2 Tax=Nitrosomonas marina TaxID=917 RepID=A0A1H8DPG8_9PROT|nr:histidine triad (HIT) family protein [Nitrosomonas marina]